MRYLLLIIFLFNKCFIILCALISIFLFKDSFQHIISLFRVKRTSLFKEIIDYVSPVRIVTLTIISLRV